MSIKVYLLLHIGILTFPARAFEEVTKPIGSLHYGSAKVNIWPSADNRPEIPSSQWSFHYDPMILPLVDENSTILINTTDYGSEWRTDLFLSYDDVTLKSLAFEKVQTIFKDVKDLRQDNLNVLPVKRIVVRFPVLPKSFLQDMMNSPSKVCPEGASCFDFYVQQHHFRVSFTSSTKEKSAKLVEALRSTQIHYEIQSYAKLRKNDIHTDDENNWISLDLLYGHLDLLIGVVGFPSASFVTQKLQTTIFRFEDSLLTSTNTTAASLQKIQSQTELSFRLLETKLESSFRNLSSHLQLQFEDALLASKTVTAVDLQQIQSHTELSIRLLETKLENSFKNLSSHFHEIFQQHNSTTHTLDSIQSNLESMSQNFNKVNETMSQWTKTDDSFVKLNLCGGKEWDYRCSLTGCFCYHLNFENLTWDTASKNCRKLNSELASITSLDEQNFVGSLIKRDTWIGSKLSQGNWTWLDRSEKTYTNLESPPTNKTDCLEIANLTKKWHPSDCGYRQHSVCKKKMATIFQFEDALLTSTNATAVGLQKIQSQTELSIRLLENKLVSSFRNVSSHLQFQFEDALLTSTNATAVGLQKIQSQTELSIRLLENKVENKLESSFRNVSSRLLEDVIQSNREFMDQIFVQVNGTKSLCSKIAKSFPCEGTEWNYKCSLTGCFCYLVNFKFLTWDAASNYCRNLRSELASITSSAEQEFIGSLINSDTWLGSTLSQGSWTWLDGSSKDYIYFDSTPNNRTGCLEIRSTTKKWYTYGCHNAQRSVCKKKTVIH